MVLWVRQLCVDGDDFGMSHWNGSCRQQNRGLSRAVRPKTLRRGRFLAREVAQSVVPRETLVT